MGQSEHFTRGTSEGRTRITEDLFGEKAGASIPRDPATQKIVTQGLYRAETAWRGPGSQTTDTIGSSFVGPQTARDLVGEAFFHPSMDQVPGIEVLRQTFDPKKNMHFIGKDTPVQGTSPQAQRWIGKQATGEHALVSAGVFTNKVSERSPVSNITGIPDMNIIVGATTTPPPNARIFTGWDNPVTQKLNGEEAPKSKALVRLGVATHEAAHAILHPEQFKGTQHSWPMARTHLAVVHALFGPKHAKALQDHYDRGGVYYGKDPLPW